MWVNNANHFYNNDFGKLLQIDRADHLHMIKLLSWILRPDGIKLFDKGYWYDWYETPTVGLYGRINTDWLTNGFLLV